MRPLNTCHRQTRTLQVKIDTPDARTNIACWREIVLKGGCLLTQAHPDPKKGAWEYRSICCLNSPPRRRDVKMIKGCFSSRIKHYMVSQLQLTDNCSSGHKNNIWCHVIIISGTENYCYKITLYSLIFCLLFIFWEK